MQQIEYFPGLQFDNIELYEKYDMNSKKKVKNGKEISYFEIIRNSFNQMISEHVKISNESELFLPNEYLVGFINWMKEKQFICNDKQYEDLTEMITYNFETNDIFIDDFKYNTILNNCIKNKKNDNVLLPIRYTLGNFGHFVMIFIDKYSKVIELYDTLAGNWFEDTMVYIVPELICKKIKEIFGLHDYKIDVVYKSCPKDLVKGIQNYEEIQKRYSSSSRLCGTWSLLLLYLRVQNTSKTFIDLENILIDTAKKNDFYISEYAHKFMIFIYINVNKMYKKNNIKIQNIIPNYLRGHYNILENVTQKNSDELNDFVKNVLNEYVDAFLDNKKNNTIKKINLLNSKMNNLFALVKKKDFNTVFIDNITRLLYKTYDEGYKKAYMSII